MGAHEQTTSNNWVVSVTMLGYVLGRTIPNSQNHLLEIEGVIILVSFIPVGIELLRSRARRSASSSQP